VRKKPTALAQSYQLLIDANNAAMPAWIEEAINSGHLVLLPDGGAEVRTLEDGADGRAKHVADHGDYIMRGVAGELYAIKPDIYAATYEDA
jgi:hypothetical protein